MSEPEESMATEWAAAETNAVEGDSAEEDAQKQEAAATKMQALQRGRAARSKAKAGRDKSEKLGVLGQARRRAALEYGGTAADMPQEVSDLASIVEELTQALAVNMSRVVDLFREWDDDASGTVDRKEFRQALPMLGLRVDKATADALFNGFDDDQSGEISYDEVYVKLRNSLIKNAGIELDDALKPGAMGEIILQSRNKIALRGGVLPAEVSGSALGSTKLLTGPDAPPIIDQLRDALQKNLSRVIDLFRDWDENGDGQISKVEFRRAMPLLGLKVDKADADALFDSFDRDLSGTVEYGELQKQLKPKPLPVLPKVRSLPRLPEVEPLLSGAEEYKQAIAAEQAAKRRLARIQKELMRSASESAIRARKEQKLLEARAVRHETVELKTAGLQMANLGADIPPATEDEVKELATRFHKQMRTLFGGPAFEVSRGMWYKLYLQMDEDKSGRITYDELRSMIRSNAGLQMDRSAMPEAKLKGLWKALDAKNTGYIDAGNFGRFMKKGEDPTPALMSAKQKLMARRSASQETLRKEEDQRVGRIDESMLANVQPLSKDDLASLAEEINAAMARNLPSGTDRAWIKLFNLVDEDGSGRIAYDEFNKMIRVHLNLSRKHIPEKRLRAAWKAIDANASGFISVGHFGRFMKKGTSALQELSSVSTATEDETIRRRRITEGAKAAARLAAKQQEEESLRDAGRRTAALARQIELDAARLEAELKRVSRLPGKKGYKPLAGLRRAPHQAPTLPEAGEAASPQWMKEHPRPPRSNDVRSFDFLPRIGRDLDW